MTKKYTVLVTGGSGFLGQHVIGLLQTRAAHVTDIRVLDITPYENKLDYTSKKPVIQYTGSICDPNLLRRACEGVVCVMHIACFVDVSMFPDEEKLKRINVQATSTLLQTCREAGVQRLIYCSSMSVAVGFSDVINGAESNTVKFLYNGYSSTKLQAEKIVLKANDDDLQTISLRPVAMYGEEDPRYITASLSLAKKTGFCLVIDRKDSLHQAAYVGNVAWAFICADKALLEDTKDTISGNAFFVADDTPVADVFKIRYPIVCACNNSTDAFKIPLWLILFTFYTMYFVLLILSPVIKVNFPYGLGTIEQIRVSHTFTHEKAKRMIGYAPLYCYNEGLERSVLFYKRYSK